MTVETEAVSPRIEVEPRGRVSFLEAIGRKDLEPLLTSKTPWTDVCLEIGDNVPGDSLSEGGKTGGGLGILEGDTRRQMIESNVPGSFTSIFYAEQWHAHVEVSDDPEAGDFDEAGNWIYKFKQKETFVQVKPDESDGYKLLGEYSLNTYGNLTPIQVWTRRVGSVTETKVYEQGIGYQYQGDPRDQKRLYVEAALGFVGFAADRDLGMYQVGEEAVLPFVVRINEAASAFYMVALLDYLAQNVGPDEAKRIIREKVIFTNHTIEPHALPDYPQGWIESAVVSNMQNQDIIGEIRGLMNFDNRLHLGDLMLHFAGEERINGVSRDHAEIASVEFSKGRKDKIRFHGETNGVNLRKWASGFVDYYRQMGVYDDHDLPAEDFKQKAEALDPDELFRRKAAAKAEFITYLKNERHDQYGNPVEIPEDRHIAVWARRIDAYKQPNLLLEDPAKLKTVLKEANMHLIIAGNAHPNNPEMKILLDRMLITIDEDPELRDRVTFVQDYNEGFTSRAVSGAAVWLNTPVPGHEACGTSVFKAIGNNALVASVPDGGMLDRPNGRYLHIVGRDPGEQRESAFECLTEAGELLRDWGTPAGIKRWGEAVRAQFADYADIISAGRMIRDYINFMYPKEEAGEEAVAA